jgi:hypothetical protein
MPGRLLAVPVRGPSAWILWQLVGDSLRVRIGQLARDPSVHPSVVAELRGLEADLRLAAAQYRELVAEATEATEVPRGEVVGGLEGPTGMDVVEVAANLNCSTRWVTTLISQGKLVATKKGRSWLVDAGSVADFQLRGANAA